MRRRAVLSTLATGTTAGCIGGILGLSSDDSRFSIENDSVPDGLPATLSATLVSGATAEHPPMLRVTFECTAKFEQTIRFGYPSPFSDVVSADTDGSRLVLQYKPDSNDRRDGCWQSGHLGGRGTTERQTLEPGEKSQVEWAVLNYAKNESCFPSGRYRFEDQYSVGGKTYSWGFWFRVR
ncbi:hypothetical protein SAMN05421858_1843 [Haladaptatus litoreus]|uniref:Lipoprotein n=1 Tax=Haladaptatus litoreus TaxID=553468 RepID=A0A1N6Z2U1_9EURY|nr:hypothetical protein [Haladaptatus litoreus]SIR21154.1 hypothetical protein SAMN05421858_1843 [Haladaptatus litoreus]